MRSNYRLLLAATVTLLLAAGCGSTPQLSSPETGIKAAPEPTPPAVELTPKLLYQLLVAEFAAQEGALRLSANTYLESAIATRDYRLARRATRLAIYAREHNTALKAATLWVELEPENGEAHKSAATMLIAAGRMDEARPHLNHLLKSQRQDSNHGFTLIASLLATDPDKGRALRIMEEFTASAPNSPHALYAHAQLAQQFGDNSRASTLLQQLLKVEPRHEQGLLLQARVLHSLGDREGSLSSMGQALKLSPDNQQLRLSYARMLIDSRHLPEARKQFRTLLKVTPNDADVLYALGLLAMEAGDLDEAEIHFQRLLELHQREEESRFALAQIAEQRQQFDEAIDWFSSIAQGERYIEAHLQAARLIHQQQGLEPARAYLRELETQNDAERVELILAEGELLNLAGKHKEAMRQHDAGLKRFKDNAELLYARGITAEKLNLLDVMERDFKRIIKLNPQDAHALNALGYTLVDRTDRIKEGFGYIERAYKLKPDDVAILDSMGWALYRLQRYDESLGYLQRAASMMRDAEIAAHLGEVLWVSGRHSEARLVWEKALEFAPEHKILQQTIKRLAP
ncbi:MAG: tetratricopeptide repeat protein [Chromatiales bacterium]|nr:tetratricopeptide repeat protein [Chromatiales bacterium]